ncbi:hypothetical protein ACXWTI_09090, partial [Streptococcus pyogenes]
MCQRFSPSSPKRARQERIVDDYENIKSTDYYTENQELKKRRESLKEVVNTWKEGYHEKSKEVNKLKR